MHEEWDDEEEEAPSCRGPKGLRIQREQCDTCIFRAGNHMSLRPGRVREMLAEVRRTESYVVCHKTLEDAVGAVCRGSYDAAYTQPLRIADRLGYVEWVIEDPRDKEGVRDAG